MGCKPATVVTHDPVRPVKTLVVAEMEDIRERTFPGKVEASRRVELAFQVPGLIVSLPVKEGQRVAEGEVIGQLRQDEFQANLKSLQGQFDQARANLRARQMGERPEERQRREANVRAAEARMANARVEVDRFANLLRSRAVAQQDYDRARTAYNVAREEHQAALRVLEQGEIGREEEIEAQEAEVRTMEGRVVEADLQLRDSTLRAPYNGVIARRLAEEQQNVQARQPIVRFQDMDELEILVDVPETVMVADIRNADIVRMTAELSGIPGVQFPVTIKEIAKVADPTTRTFSVRVGMQAPKDSQILPGMTAVVNVEFRRAQILGDGIRVPVSAIMQDASGESLAWAIGADQTVERRPVKLGEILGDDIEVIKGLRPGDRIAVAGVTFLREGMKVRDLGNALGGGSP